MTQTKAELEQKLATLEEQLRVAQTSTISKNTPITIGAVILLVSGAVGAVWMYTTDQAADVTRWRENRTLIESMFTRLDGMEAAVKDGFASINRVTDSRYRAPDAAFDCLLMERHNRSIGNPFECPPEILAHRNK